MSTFPTMRQAAVMVTVFVAGLVACVSRPAVPRPAQPPSVAAPSVGAAPLAPENAQEQAAARLDLTGARIESWVGDLTSWSVPSGLGYVLARLRATQPVHLEVVARLPAGARPVLVATERDEVAVLTTDQADRLRVSFDGMKNVVDLGVVHGAFLLPTGTILTWKDGEIHVRDARTGQHLAQATGKLPLCIQAGVLVAGGAALIPLECTDGGALMALDTATGQVRFSEGFPMQSVVSPSGKWAAAIDVEQKGSSHISRASLHELPAGRLVFEREVGVLDLNGSTFVGFTPDERGLVAWERDSGGPGYHPEPTPVAAWQIPSGRPMPVRSSKGSLMLSADQSRARLVQVALRGQRIGTRRPIANEFSHISVQRGSATSADGETHIAVVGNTREVGLVGDAIALLIDGHGAVLHRVEIPSQGDGSILTGWTAGDWSLVRWNPGSGQGTGRAIHRRTGAVRDIPNLDVDGVKSTDGEWIAVDDPASGRQELRRIETGEVARLPSSVCSRDAGSTWASCPATRLP